MPKNFDPKKHTSGDDGSYLEVAGEYLLAGRTLKRDKNRNDKPYLLVRFEVLHGPMQERIFQDRIYINDEALWKVGRWCESMDQADSFDISCNQSSYDALCNMPFKAKVKVQTNGEKKYAEIDQFYKKLTDAEVAFINKWRAGWEATVEADGDKRRPRPGAGRGGGGGDGDPQGGGFGDDPGPGGSEFSDDDIPF